jgi:hypothetical protein
MTRLRLSDPSLLGVLMADLRTRPDVVVHAVGADALEIAILGSYNVEAMRLAIYLRVRAWEAAQRALGHDLHVELI